MLDYDIIVLGLGVVTNYFGIPGMEDFSYGIKSFGAIRRFKEHLHNQIEDERRPDLNYVIVGAGPTGIELAGALPEYLRKVMEIHGVKHKAVYIDLIEAAPACCHACHHRPHYVSQAGCAVKVSNSSRTAPSKVWRLTS